MPGEKRVTLGEAARILRDLKQAIDKVHQSPKAQEAVARAKATLADVATRSPEEQKAYWDRVGENLRRKTEELRKQREEAERVAGR